MNNAKCTKIERNQKQMEWESLALVVTTLHCSRARDFISVHTPRVTQTKKTGKINEIDT